MNNDFKIFGYEMKPLIPELQPIPQDKIYLKIQGSTTKRRWNH